MKMKISLRPPSALRGRWRALTVLAALAAGAAVLLPPALGERVPVLSVGQGELRQAIVASGRVRTPQRVEVASQIGGRVLAVDVREGDRVAVGARLVQLDEAEWQAARQQAQATLVQSEVKRRQLGELGLPVAEQGLRQAEANLAQAERQFGRVRELVARGFYSPTQLDDAQRALEVARSQRETAALQVASSRPGGSDVRLAANAVEQARAGLALATARQGYARIDAPVAGTVLTRTVEPGDTIQAGRVLLTLAPAGDTELVAQIDEKSLGLLRLGQPAQVSADAYPEQRFRAELSFIAPSVDAQRGSVEIRLRVPEPPAYLRHEMTVSIDIEAARRGDAVLAPLEGVRDAQTAAPWVLVVRDGVAVRQTVRLGIRGDSVVEVLEGLAAGEALIPARANVAEGRRVRPAAG